jgi:hypothetical protein
LNIKKVEYEKENNEKYKTNFIRYLDATASRPQINSLLFLLEEFAEYLNLIPRALNNNDDFYTILIKRFLKEYKEITEMDINDVIILRKIFKRSILTMLYGVTYRSFKKYIVEGLLENIEKIENKR